MQFLNAVRHTIKGFNDNELPLEFEKLAFVYAAKDLPTDKAAYYYAKQYLETLLASLHIAIKSIVFETLNQENIDHTRSYYQPGRSASVSVDGVTIGYVGEFRTAVKNHSSFRMRVPASKLIFLI